MFKQYKISVFVTRIFQLSRSGKNNLWGSVHKRSYTISNRKKGNLRIKNFVTTSDFYNKGCGCRAYETVGTSPYGQQLKS